MVMEAELRRQRSRILFPGSNLRMVSADGVTHGSCRGDRAWQVAALNSRVAKLPRGNSLEVHRGTNMEKTLLALSQGSQGISLSPETNQRRLPGALVGLAPERPDVGEHLPDIVGWK